MTLDKKMKLALFTNSVITFRTNILSSRQSANRKLIKTVLNTAMRGVNIELDLNILAKLARTN